jgi:cell division protein FtsQ
MSPSTTATRDSRPPKPQAGGNTARHPSLAEQRRRRTRRVRRIQRVLIVALVVAVLAATGWLVGFSSVLATKRVAVSGTKLLSVDGVKTAAAVPIGLPLARQDTSAIADRVAHLAPVDTVSVDRGWPHTLTIRVVERTPLVAVRGGTGYLLVDHTGFAFETVSRLPAGVVEVGIESGNAALLAQAGTIATAIPPALRDQVVTISASAPDSFRVKLDSGLTIVWGDAGQSALKGQVALLLLKKKPKAIDVSAPHSPAVR